MPNPQMPFQIVPGAQMGNHQIVTPDQKAEIEQVRGMQVRTAAADQSTKLLAGKAPSIERWLKIATAIERYILGLEPEPDPGPAVGRPSVP